MLEGGLEGVFDGALEKGAAMGMKGNEKAGSEGASESGTRKGALLGGETAMAVESWVLEGVGASGVWERAWCATRARRSAMAALWASASVRAASGSFWRRARRRAGRAARRPARRARRRAACRGADLGRGG